MPPAEKRSEDILNVAAYRFVSIDDPQALRARWLAAAQAAALKGTMLIAPEGVNFFLAGPTRVLEAFLRVEVLSDPRFAAIELKRSESDSQPFKRLKVKVKKEIVTFDQPGINPALAPAPSVSAEDFKVWQTEGRDMIVLDTRNTFEFERGAFDGSVHLGNDNFRAFAAAIDAAPEEWKDKTVVTFCTGGIRCEKAAPYLQARGFKNVYQLQGGILRYFETVGNAHYHGDCFVFDERTALDSELSPTTETTP